MPADKTRFRSFPKDPFIKFTNQPVIQYEKPIKGGIVEIIERNFEIKEGWESLGKFPILVARERWKVPTNLLYANNGTVTGWNGISQTGGLGDVRFGVGLLNPAYFGKNFSFIQVKLRRVGNPSGSVTMRIIQKDSGLGGKEIFSLNLGSASAISTVGTDFVISLPGVGFKKTPYIWNTIPLCITFENSPQTLPSGNRIEIALGADMPSDVKVSSSLLSQSTGADIWGLIT